MEQLLTASLLPAYISCLNLIQQEIIHIFQGIGTDFIVHGRRVEYKHHAFFAGSLHDIANLADFILQYQVVPLLKVVHNPIHHFPGNLLVGAAEEKDAVAPVLCLLDNGMAGLSIQHGYILRIHPGFL